MADYFDEFRKNFLTPAGGGVNPSAGAEAPKGNQGTTDWMAAIMKPFFERKVPDPGRWTGTEKIIESATQAATQPKTDTLDVNKVTAAPNNNVIPSVVDMPDIRNWQPKPATTPAKPTDTTDWLARADQINQELGLPQGLLRAMIGAESSGNQNAVSPKGAVGLMQLMPGTAKDLGVNPNDPEQNIRGGATYIKQMLDKFQGNLPLALEAYNAGPGNVGKMFKGVGDYVNKIISRLGPSTAYAGEPTLPGTEVTPGRPFHPAGRQYYPGDDLIPIPIGGVEVIRGNERSITNPATGETKMVGEAFPGQYQAQRIEDMARTLLNAAMGEKSFTKKDVWDKNGNWLGTEPVVNPHRGTMFNVAGNVIKGLDELHKSLIAKEGVEGAATIRGQYDIEQEKVKGQVLKELAQQGIEKEESKKYMDHVLALISTEEGDENTGKIIKRHDTSKIPAAGKVVRGLQKGDTSLLTEGMKELNPQVNPPRGFEPTGKTRNGKPEYYNKEKKAYWTP